MAIKRFRLPSGILEYDYDDSDEDSDTAARIGDSGAGSDSAAFHEDVSGEFDDLTEKSAPLAADLVAIESSGDSYAKRKAQLGNLTRKVSTANISNPPTDAELDSAFGTPANVGAGFFALVNDNGDGNNFYLVASDGTNWWHAAMTKAT